MFLMLYLMGMQNTPDKGSWTVDQPTMDEYAIDMYFHDHSAMLMFRLTDNEVTIERVGSKPSMAYTLQETVIVDGVLHELQMMVSDEKIEEPDRLLRLVDVNAIEKARSSLAFV